MTQHFTKDEFEAAIASGVTLVDFWATWCGPCRMVAPVIDRISDDYNTRATVGKVDVDEYSEIAVRYGIQSIPTVLIFKDGELVNTLIGARGQDEYAAALDAALA